MTNTPDQATPTTALAPRRGPGRPAKEIDPDQVQYWAARGLSAESIARKLGISTRTMFYKLQDDPTVREAFDCGQAEGIAFAADRLFELIAEKNLGAICFYLRSKAAWRAVPQEINVTHAHRVDASVTLTTHVAELAAEHGRLLDMSEDEIESGEPSLADLLG